MIWQFFVCVLCINSNKNGRASSRKIVKTLMENFRKIEVLTENTIQFDVTFSVILGTVSVRGLCSRSEPIMLGFPYEERLLRLPRLQGGSFGHTVLWHWLCGLRKGLWHCWTSRSMEIGCDGVSHWSAKLKRNGVTQKTKKKARQGPGKILFFELKVFTKLSHYSQVY